MDRRKKFRDNSSRCELRHQHRGFLNWGDWNLKTKGRGGPLDQVLRYITIGLEFRKQNETKQTRDYEAQTSRA